MNMPQMPLGLDVVDQLLVDGVRARQLRPLARTITLIESLRPDHRARAQRVIEALLPDTGGAMRVGISGVPGVGKSTFIEALGLSVTDAAHALGVTRPALSALLNERAHLSPEMALRIEKAFGVSMDTLMRMQNSFDIAQARKRENEINVAPFTGKAQGPQRPLL